MSARCAPRKVAVGEGETGEMAMSARVCRPLGECSSRHFGIETRPPQPGERAISWRCPDMASSARPVPSAQIVAATVRDVDAARGFDAHGRKDRREADAGESVPPRNAHFAC